jgi:hypothetical protein
MQTMINEMETRVGFRFSKLSLYRYLSILKDTHSVRVKPVNVDGWHIQIENSVDVAKKIHKVCEASSVMDSDYYQNHSGTGYLVTITRCGMDVDVQDLFDRASKGEWRSIS